MANVESKLISAIKTILTNDATLAAYVKGVDLGRRDNVPKTAFPRICIEPLQTDEVLGAIPRRHNLAVKIEIWCMMAHALYASQIVGDAQGTGIYDFVDQVKNALDVYPTLDYDSTGARVNFFLFPSTRYYWHEYPYRYGVVTFEGKYLTSGANR